MYIIYTHVEVARDTDSIDAVYCDVLQSVAECCSVMQCVAVCCGVLQCMAVCCSLFLGVRRHIGLPCVHHLYACVFVCVCV